MNDELKRFLEFWFDGFSEGLDQLDPASQDTLLKACGLACARSYTAQVFQDTWEKSRSLQDFLDSLAEKFPEARYDLRDQQTILVQYDHCACDLVANGWVKTPVLCKCSRHNLQQNFELALGINVKVELKSSILAGDDHCQFIVTIDPQVPQ